MERRDLLRCLASLTLAAPGLGCSRLSDRERSREAAEPPREAAEGGITLFLAGDVMTGRGIDQILPHPSNPKLYERYMQSALGYVELAEQANGPIPRTVSYEYIWGDALAELARVAPAARIVNLETAVTDSDLAQPKGINYRMHPKNVGCLRAARIDCCVLSNNHVLDWGPRGLRQTLDGLHDAGLQTAGAGTDLAEALAPAIIKVGASDVRILVFGFAAASSGVPIGWAATPDRAGVSLSD